MEKTLNTRISQKIDTTVNWNSSTLVLNDGELGIEITSDGNRRIKIGDGVSTWVNLEYYGGSVENILDGIASGSVRTSSSEEESTSYKLGNAAFAEGSGTKASGNFSHAEGLNTTASGAYSHAEGRQTTASGSVSHAEGTDTVASGIRSHAGGYGTIANGENQTAIGKYNVQDNENTYAFIIGNGTGTTNRSNVFTVDWNGNVNANGQKLATETYVNSNGGAIDTVQVNGEDLTISEKTVNIIVPTKTSDLTNDSGFLVENDVANLAEKATTLEGYGITDAYTKTETDSKVGAILGTSSDDSAQNTVYGSRALAQQKVAEVTAADSSISVGGTTTNPSVGVKISLTAANGLSLEDDGLYVNVPSSVDYTVAVTESTPEGYAKAYTITQAATGLNTTINIPKDMVVSSGTVETKEESGEWGEAGTYLVLTLANATSDKVYVNVGSLIEYVTSGSAADDQIQIVVSQDHKVTASLKDGSVTKTQLDSSVQTSLNKADAAAPQSSLDILSETVAAHTTKLGTIAEGAEVNVQSDWVQTDTSADDFIKNKPTNLAYIDLTNIDNETFKAKVEASGFTSGTKVSILRWEETD